MILLTEKRNLNVYQEVKSIFDSIVLKAAQDLSPSDLLLFNTEEDKFMEEGVLGSRWIHLPHIYLCQLDFKSNK